MEYKQYYDYLQSISWRGKLYRKLIIYPEIDKHCSGDILDIGCGLGLFLHRHQNSTGVDINQFCVEHCQSQGLRVLHMEEDTLPFKNDKKFDTLVLDNVIEHIADPKPLLNECRRVMSPTSKLIIVVPGLRGFKRDTDHKKYYDFEALKVLASENEFVLSHKKSLPLPGIQSILSSFCFFVVFQKNQ